MDNTHAWQNNFVFKKKKSATIFKSKLPSLTVFLVLLNTNWSYMVEITLPI